SRRGSSRPRAAASASSPPRDAARPSPSRSRAASVRGRRRALDRVRRTSRRLRALDVLRGRAMATAARPSPSSSRGPARILVVENEHVLNASLVHALTREGYEAVGARSLAEARQQQGFDLALLDLDLGDGSGLALLEEWRARGL